MIKIKFANFCFFKNFFVIIYSLELITTCDYLCFGDSKMTKTSFVNRKLKSYTLSQRTADTGIRHSTWPGVWGWMCPGGRWSRGGSGPVMLREAPPSHCWCYGCGWVGLRGWVPPAAACLLPLTLPTLPSCCRLSLAATYRVVGNCCWAVSWTFW